MPELVCLKVRIGKADGRAKYPTFNSLQAVKDSGVDWSKYVDTFGAGWQYDKKFGHAEEGPDSPMGMQWGVLLVPSLFADQAVAAFPADCQIIAEAAMQTFYEDRVTAHMPEDLEDVNILQSLNAELSLIDQAIAGGRNGGKLATRRDLLLTRIEKAVDPADPEPGVRKNMKKRWVDMKSERGITIKP